ncbi:type I-E CRISPR-associated protein Cas6/Cse3/CasE [Lentzea sp. NPDC055074]
MFEGLLLHIAGPDQLRHSLTHGLGPPKGQGFGLITLALVRRA